MKCECCGEPILNFSEECSLCGRKICYNCTMILTPLFTFLSITPSTIHPVGTTYSPTTTAKKIDRLIICRNCTDLLKLSLRVAAAKGIIDEKERESY